MPLDQRTRDPREAEGELREREERYRHILGVLPVAVYTCDAPSGVITFYNPEAAALWGRQPRPGDTEERFCGSFRLWRPDGTPLPHDQTPMAAAIREGRAFRNQDVIIERPDGSRIRVLVNIDPIVDPEGHVVGAVNAFHDTTTLTAAQQALLESENRFRLAQSIARMGTFELNLQTGVNAWTPELESIYGLTPGEFEKTQSAFERLVHPDDLPGTLAAAEQAIRTGESTEHEWRIVCPDGSVRWIAGRFQCIKNGQGTPLRLSGVNIDITDRKRADAIDRQLAAIVESSDDAIIGQDMTGTITSWNRAAERLYGYAADEIVGKAVSVLIPPDHTDDFPSIMERLWRGERIDHFETVRIAKDGRRIDVSLTVSPIKDANGSIVGASKIARDITAQRRADSALRTHGERTRLLWEAAGVLLTTDKPDALLQGLFAKISASFGLDIYLNYMVAENALQLVSGAGMSNDELRSISRLNFGQAICGTVAQRRTPIVATRIQESTEPMVQLVKGFGIRAYACSPLLAGGRLLGTLSFASRTRDEFDQDEIEFLQTISHYVAAVYERLGLIERLRDQDRRKDEFLATLAHELRNPLAPIRTGVQLVRRARHNPELLDKACPMMERQLQHMVRLVDDLLDVSRISRNKLELRKEWVDLAAVVQSAVETSRPVIEAAGHEITVSLPAEPVLLDADMVRLAQAFSNLLNNAAKYTERGGHIWLTAELAVGGGQSPGQVIVRVRDTGIGIPVDKLPDIFGMFVQGEQSIDRSHGGLGIGLTLAQRLVQMHGGKLVAASDGPGKGSEFSVHLPVLVMPPLQAVRRDGENLEMHRARVPRRILVVDDSPDSAEMLATILTVLGHEVATALDGLDAIERGLTLQPEAVFLDLGMPRINGYDAARRIREQPWGRAVMLVAVTGWGHEEDKRRSQEAGFDAHLVKPVDLAAIEKLLDALSDRPAVCQ